MSPKRLFFSQCFLTFTALASLLSCPFSKVEESFALQATHDLFYYHSHNHYYLEQYDHRQYPGVVPRTFLGPLVQSTACQCLCWLLWNNNNNNNNNDDDTYCSPRFVQALARGIHLLFMLQAWFRFAKDNPWILIVTACQFHLPFYASRLLPNSTATIFTLHAFAEWRRHNHTRAAAVWLVVAAAFVRCDLILLLITVGLSWLYCRHMTVCAAIRIGITTVLCVGVVLIPIDSYLWGTWVWPEAVVFYYNTVLNKSSDWGVSAWHWYWTTALPKALLFTGFLVPWCVVSPAGNIDTTYLPFLLPALGFVALYSFLGHKEVRFLFPVLPLFNMCAAAGMARLEAWAWPPKDKVPTKIGKILYALGILCLVLSFAASSVFVAVSRWNYPGGHALRILEQEMRSFNTDLHVHVDVAAAMTGISLFEQRAMQNCVPTTFYKDGYEQENQNVGLEERFTHLLGESNKREGFHLIASAPGHPRLDWRNLRIVTEPAIFVLERDGWRDSLQ